MQHNSTEDGTLCHVMNKDKIYVYFTRRYDYRPILVWKKPGEKLIMEIVKGKVQYFSLEQCANNQER